MSALHAVPDPTGSGPVAGAAPGNAADPIDLTDDPRTDPEALLLCALMWTTDTVEARRIVDVLTLRDFDRAVYVELFERIRDLITDDRPHGPASVLADMVRGGAGGQQDAPLRIALTDVTMAGADGTSGATATHYADIVLSQSYRRSFHVAGQRLVQSAEQTPEEELFEHMVELGTAQRAFRNRLDAFRAGHPM